MPRVQRRFLLHSRWTAHAPIAGSDGARHFEVIDAPGGDVITVRAALTQRDYPITAAMVVRESSGSRTTRTRVVGHRTSEALTS